MTVDHSRNVKPSRRGRRKRDTGRRGRRRTTTTGPAGKGRREARPGTRRSAARGPRAGAAHRRAAVLGVTCRYVVAAVPGAPLRTGCADLVYTGEGAPIWMRGLAAWARDVARLLRPAGHLFVPGGRPVELGRRRAPDPGRPQLLRRFLRQRHVPRPRAVEWQWTLGEIVNVVLAAGLEPLHLAEHPEPFRRPDAIAAAAWVGRLPNSFSLLARRRPRRRAGSTSSRADPREPHGR